MESAAFALRTDHRGFQWVLERVIYIFMTIFGGEGLLSVGGGLLSPDALYNNVCH